MATESIKDLVLRIACRVANDDDNPADGNADDLLLEAMIFHGAPWFEPALRDASTGELRTFAKHFADHIVEQHLGCMLLDVFHKNREVLQDAAAAAALCVSLGRTYR